MPKSFLKGTYYVPKDINENPYSILKNANKNNLNFIIIEYSNKYLFDGLSNDKISRLNYIQDKIDSFEKKYRNTVGIICFKCHSIIGPIRILLSKSIFKGDIFKLKNFYLWCYLNNPTLILSNNSFMQIYNENTKKYFTLYNDNFLKSIDNYLNLLNLGINVTPIYVNNGFIFIRNKSNNVFDFRNLKQYISSQIKNGNFYISNSDKLYLDYTLSTSNLSDKQYISLNIKLSSTNFSNKKLVLLNNKHDFIIDQNLYSLKNISYNVDIKKGTNKFFILRILSHNNLFALTSPIYIDI
ncbi:hypothetical protein [Candidatus Arthromitus sp. SFB-rat-Yit]|uniref:hypothetical protein n=1 Tax=Candidatus Arthromitus sp. SFB-rat-Yit TaxID=1041504 RepID=UPI000227A50E|nr:hypothetical protein [Candidatus Arthromitus sp. SFB-rat-Yit]BAK81599.1 hypothetical protein RATSFB_1037 [Candidatus Arthromitus sp. SFB-rat-Yit]